MAGHSKWATTKHRKAAQDKKRSALFSKLSRMITVAAKAGMDANPDSNASLAAAIAKAKSYSLPKDRIESAIGKAFGPGESAAYEEVVYEGYGPAGVAIYVEALTDNRNRTAADVRSAFSRAGGNLGATGSVAFQFQRKGQVVLESTTAQGEDDLVLVVADAGGEDLEATGEEWVVTTAPVEMMRVKAALEAVGLPVKGAELVMDPVSETVVSAAEASRVLRLIDQLEAFDDVQNVYHNMAFTDEIAASLSE
ncbi:MAG TPA: YebC/PmpR family DNA-binding transcriptional regulator [Coriobacteriia bacterium]|nr:YebC/PmpR family DNA-binding transcriptional regulator [Coriobacteriia bacterium]